jgi:hypothetical protein
MRVVALGCYGKVGYSAIKMIAKSNKVSEIVVAGRNLERASKVANELGAKASAKQVDGTDLEQLSSLFDGKDIIVNAALDDTVIPAIQAAIKSKVDYCDINVGNVPQALELSNDAKAAGITAVVANGIHPCISNLMGIHVASQLEEVIQLQIGFADIINFQNGEELTLRQWKNDPKESLTKLHEFKYYFEWMLQVVQEKGIKPILIYKNNKWVRIDPVRKGIEIPTTKNTIVNAFPYASSHPLFDALPNNLATDSPVEVFFSLLPPQLHQLLRELCLQISNGDHNSESAINIFYEKVESDPGHWLTIPKKYNPLPISKMWVRALGYKNGKPASYACWFPKSIWQYGGYFLTSVALAVGVLKILHGEIHANGVVTGEKAFKPLPFFKHVKKFLPDLPIEESFIYESLQWL